MCVLQVHNVTFAFELMQDAGLQKPKARPEGERDMDHLAVYMHTMKSPAGQPTPDRHRAVQLVFPGDDGGGDDGAHVKESIPVCRKRQGSHFSGISLISGKSQVPFQGNSHSFSEKGM